MIGRLCKNRYFSIIYNNPVKISSAQNYTIKGRIQGVWRLLRADFYVLYTFLRKWGLSASVFCQFLRVPRATGAATGYEYSKILIILASSFVRERLTYSESVFRRLLGIWTIFYARVGNKALRLSFDYAVGQGLLSVLHIKQVWSTIVSSLQRLSRTSRRSYETGSTLLCFWITPGPEPPG